MTDKNNIKEDPINLVNWRKNRGTDSEQAYELAAVLNPETKTYDLMATDLAADLEIAMETSGRLDVAADLGRVVQEILGSEGALAALYCGLRPRITRHGYEQIWKAYIQSLGC